VAEKSAERSCNCKKPDLDDLCFHAQQAAEKALKGVLVAHGAVFPRSHSIGLLFELISKIQIKVPQELMEEASELTIYAVQARYPGDHVVDFDEYREAAATAEKVVRWAEEHVKRFSDNQ
jgi:HEPN domain-containing protein